MSVLARIHGNLSKTDQDLVVPQVSSMISILTHALLSTVHHALLTEQVLRGLLTRLPQNVIVILIFMLPHCIVAQSMK